CEQKGVRFIKEFNDATTCSQFFMSWRNLQPVRGKATVLDSPVHLSTSTKRAERERFGAFLEFCKIQGWLTVNQVRIKNGPCTVGISKPTKKYAPTLDEYNDIVHTLENWNGDSAIAKQQIAFSMCLAFTGQRISDVVMFNEDTFVCDDGQWFAELTQIKT